MLTCSRIFTAHVATFVSVLAAVGATLPALSFPTVTVPVPEASTSQRAEFIE